MRYQDGQMISRNSAVEPMQAKDSAQRYLLRRSPVKDSQNPDIAGDQTRSRIFQAPCKCDKVIGKPITRIKVHDTSPSSYSKGQTDRTVAVRERRRRASG